ncbi:hypothetical protein [Hymenobacter piscis]|nr:hypothetical protein [Hymenobacter piscis]
MATLDLTVQYTPRNLLLDFVASIQHERHVLCRVMGCFQPYAT